MRFDRIFDDLEGRMEHLEGEERRAMTQELTRAERAQVALADRLRAAVDRRVALRLSGGISTEGSVEAVGADWVRLRGAAGARCWVPLAHAVIVEGLPPRSAPPASSRLSPPSLGHELRRLAQDRATVRLATSAGTVVGRIAAVGADALDIRQLPTGERSLSPGSALATVVMGSIVLVTAEPEPRSDRL